MRYFLSLILTLFNLSVFAMGDTSIVPKNPDRMTGTVRRLNQVQREEISPPPVYESTQDRKFSTQDIQESLYQEDLKREKKQWEESKIKDKGR